MVFYAQSTGTVISGRFVREGGGGGGGAKEEKRRRKNDVTVSSHKLGLKISHKESKTKLLHIAKNKNDFVISLTPSLP